MTLGDILKNGGAVILPTETVYGLFAKAFDEKAVHLVYQLKKRPKDKALNLNVSNFEMILKYSTDQPLYLEKIYNHFMPGPLTIILKAAKEVPIWINSGLPTIGFRVPKHPVTLDLIDQYGPLIGPSANISGNNSGTIFERIIREFNKEVTGYADDYALTGKDSTILDLSNKKARILRQGAITKSMLMTAVPELKFEGEIDDI